jgi:polysaccharide biosynthesis/export protein
MRVTRSILLLLAVAITAAGCGFQPAPWVPMAAAPMGAPPEGPVASAPAPGIDNTIYGSVAQNASAVAADPAPDPDRGLLMTAAASPSAPPAAPVSMADPAAPLNEPYTLDSGDRLRIVVFGQDGLSNSYLVDASGYIDMPLIGSVLARGATTGELSRRIDDKLRQGYIKDPHVAVEIEAYRPFFILGEVTQPGQYPYVADMTAETAVAIAGGFSPRAFRKTVTVTRIVHGQQVRLSVPITYPLRPGDTVNVQERWF